MLVIISVVLPSLRSLFIARKRYKKKRAYSSTIPLQMHEPTVPECSSTVFDI